MSIKVKSWSAVCGRCSITLAMGEEKISKDFEWSFGQFKERLAGTILDMLGVGLAWVGDGDGKYARPIVVGRGPETMGIETMNGNSIKVAWYDLAGSQVPHVFVGNRAFDVEVDQTVTSAEFAPGRVQEDDDVSKTSHPQEIGGVRYEF